MQKDKSQKVDYWFLMVTAVLVLWGIFTVGTTSFPLSLEKYGTPWHYFFHQLLMLGLGIVLGLVCFKVPLQTLKKVSPYLFLLNLIAASLVFLPKIGIKISGGQRWLNLGGILFQPSEFLKISFIIYLAAWLSARIPSYKRIDRPKKNELSFIRLFLPFIVMLMILVIILILQSDMTTLVILCLIGVGLYFAAATPWWHTLIISVGGFIGGILLIVFKPYRAARLSAFLKPEIDPLGKGYQIRQASIAIGSGKIIGIENGLAFGLSRQKFGFLPHPMTDSIFAIIGEETGFIGSCFLILLFLFFAWRGLKIVAESGKNFERLLALGVIIWISSQTILNIGGITGILPLGGIPLPFFSYGGSHLIAEMIGVGILLNISKK